MVKMNSLKDLTEAEIDVLDEKILEIQKIRKRFYGEDCELNDGLYEIIYIALFNLKSSYE